MRFLLDRGYDVKPVTTFIGNHYLFSERQRMALARSVSAEEWIKMRIDRELLQRKDNSAETLIIPDVDRALEELEGVISGDAIILNRCISWLMRESTVLLSKCRVIWHF